MAVAEARITILLVSFSRLLRDAFRLLLADSGFEIVGEAASADEALAHLMSGTETPPELVLLNLESYQDSLSLWSRLRLSGTSKLVAISHEADLIWIDSDQAKSLDGIVTYDVSFSMLLQSLRLVRAGERIFPSSFLQAVAKRSEVSEAETEGHTLSPREADIVRHLANGSSNKAIAIALGIAETTVKVHIKAALRKIGVANRTQAALWAQLTGFDQRMVRAERSVRDTEERIADQEALIAKLEGESDLVAVQMRREELENFRHNLEIARMRLKLQRNTLRSGS